MIYANPKEREERKKKKKKKKKFADQREELKVPPLSTALVRSSPASGNRLELEKTEGKKKQNKNEKSSFLSFRLNLLLS